MYTIAVGDYTSNHRTAKSAAAAYTRELRKWGRDNPVSSILRDGVDIGWNHLAALARAEKAGKPDSALLRYERMLDA